MSPMLENDDDDSKTDDDDRADDTVGMIAQGNAWPRNVCVEADHHVADSVGTGILASRISIAVSNHAEEDDAKS